MTSTPLVALCFAGFKRFDCCLVLAIKHVGPANFDLVLWLINLLMISSGMFQKLKKGKTRDKIERYCCGGINGKPF